MTRENASKEPVIFQPGDTVAWAEPVYGLWRRKFGEGPFQIKSVESVPQRKCNMLAACGNISAHVPECNMNRARAVGHPQYLVVITMRGDSRFSGAWFSLAYRRGRIAGFFKAQVG